MTKKLIATLLTIVLMFALTACGPTQVLYAGEYDETKYAQVTDISGVSILAPKDIHGAAEPISKASEYESADLPNHVFTASDDKSYTIYQPGKFFLYTFDLGSIDNIETQLDVSDIPGLIGTSDWLSFETRNPNTLISTEKNGDSQIIYGATITESMVGSELSYNGYVTILHHGETDSAYCYVIGYGDDKNDDTALALAENFLLME